MVGWGGVKADFSKWRWSVGRRRVKVQLGGGWILFFLTCWEGAGVLTFVNHAFALENDTQVQKTPEIIAPCKKIFFFSPKFQINTHKQGVGAFVPIYTLYYSMIVKTHM